MADTVVDHLRAALADELEELHREILLLVDPLDDHHLWRRPVTPGNSVGHLLLHLTGNLNHFVGAQLGGSGFVRDRDREFNETNPPSKTKLLVGFAEAVTGFRHVVATLPAPRWTQAHPSERLGSMTKALVHLVAHFALHRGQISILTRIP